MVLAGLQTSPKFHASVLHFLNIEHFSLNAARTLSNCSGRIWAAQDMMSSGVEVSTSNALFMSKLLDERTSNAIQTPMPMPALFKYLSFVIAIIFWASRLATCFFLCSCTSHKL